MADKTFRASLILSAIDKMSFVVNQATAKSIAKLDNLQKKAEKVSRVTRDFGAVSFGAGIAAAAGIGLMVKHYADAADKIRKSSEQVGLSVETYQELNHAAKLAGLSTEDFQGSMLKLSKNSADSAAGIGKSKVAFEALDMKLTDQNGKLRDSESLLPEIADKLSKVRSANLRTALAIRIFGDSGAKMVNMLSEGSAGLTKMREEARKLGAVISEDDAKAAEEFNDNTERLNVTLGGFRNIMGSSLVPVLNDSVLKLTEIAVSIKNWTKSHPGITKAIIITGGVLTGLLIVLGAATLSIAAVAWSIGVWSSALKSVQLWMKATTIASWALNASMWWIIAGVVALAASVYLIIEYWDPITKFFSDIWGKIKESFSAFFSWVADSAKLFVQNFVAPIAAIPLLINKYGSQLFEAGKNIVGMIWEGIKAMASKPVEAIQEIIQKMRDMLPFSPAKVGPFRDLHKVKISETLAMAIKPAPVVNAMRGVTAAAMVAVASPEPATNAVSNYSSPFSLTYSPSITMGGSGGGSVHDFGSLLNQHKNEIVRIVDGAKERKSAKEY